MISIDCQCGEKYFADEQHIGQQIKCKKCNRILTIGRSELPPKIQSIIEPHREPATSKRFSQASSSQTGLSAWQIVGVIASATVIVLIFIIGFSKFGDRQPSRQDTRSKVVQQKPTGGQNPTRSSLENNSLLSKGHGGYDLPKPSSRVASSTSTRPKQSKKPSFLHGRSEDEPTNPNVPPLGYAPFDYDIRQGTSTLMVDNGTETDALVRVIRLTYGSEGVRNFFIPFGAKYTAEQIPPGTYVLRVAFGRDWNSSSRRFNYRQSFSETQTFTISETRWNESVVNGYIEHTKASEISITLHKVPFGNFSSHPITEAAFWK